MMIVLNVVLMRIRNLDIKYVKQPINGQGSVVLGRNFFVTHNGLCVSVLLNTLDTTVSIQRGRKLGYA